MTLRVVVLRGIVRQRLGQRIVGLGQYAKAPTEINRLRLLPMLAIPAFRELIHLNPQVYENAPMPGKPQENPKEQSFNPSQEFHLDFHS